MRNLESFSFISSDFELIGGQTYQSIARRGGKKTRPLECSIGERLVNESLVERTISTERPNRLPCSDLFTTCNASTLAEHDYRPTEFSRTFLRLQ